MHVHSSCVTKELSVGQLCIFSLLAIVVSEIAIRFTIRFFNIASWTTRFLLDCSILSLVTFLILYFMLYRPITRQLAVIRRNNEELHLYTKAFEKVREAIIVTDANNRIIRVNPAFSSITGYATEEVIGREPSILQSGRQSPEFYHNMWETLTKTGEWNGEIWNLRKNGQIYPERLSIVADYSESGQIQGYVGTFGDITNQKKHEKILEEKAHYDPLTKLPNRSLFNDRLRQSISLAGRHKRRCAMLFIDLDHFKEVNDSLGHDAGDNLLVQVATRLQACVRISDTVARLGGDEFAVILHELVNDTDATIIAEKIVFALREAFELGNKVAVISASVGVAVFPDDAMGIDLLVKRADQSMYKAKQTGRNKYMRCQATQFPQLLLSN